MSEQFAKARQDVCHHARVMWETGLVVASAGNVSTRAGERYIAITPTSLAYEVMTPEDVVIVDLESGQSTASSRQSSYELPMHLVIYRHRPHLNAIVHTHSPFVTALSIARRPLPPVIDEMVMYFGGTVEVAEYAFTGTEAVGSNVLAALGDRTAVILANHGNVCVGRDLTQALHVATVMEAAARSYIHALQIGAPVVLPDHAIKEGRRLFDERKKI